MARTWHARVWLPCRAGARVVDALIRSGRRARDRHAAGLNQNERIAPDTLSGVGRLGQDKLIVSTSHRRDLEKKTRILENLIGNDGCEPGNVRNNYFTSISPGLPRILPLVGLLFPTQGACARHQYCSKQEPLKAARHWQPFSTNRGHAAHRSDSDSSGLNPGALCIRMAYVTADLA